MIFTRVSSLLSRLKLAIRNSNKLTWELLSLHRLIRRKVSLELLKGMPHRQILCNIVAANHFSCVAEYGCSSGANLVLIHGSGFSGDLLYYDLSLSAVLSCFVSLKSIPRAQPSLTEASFFKKLSALARNGPLLVIIDAVIMYMTHEEVVSLLRKLSNISRAFVYLTYWDWPSMFPLGQDETTFADGVVLHSLKDILRECPGFKLVDSGDMSPFFEDSRWRKYGRYLLISTDCC